MAISLLFRCTDSDYHLGIFFMKIKLFGNNKVGWGCGSDPYAHSILHQYKIDYYRVISIISLFLYVMDIRIQRYQIIFYI